MGRMVGGGGGGGWSAGGVARGEAPPLYTAVTRLLLVPYVCPTPASADNVRSTSGFAPIAAKSSLARCRPARPAARSPRAASAAPRARSHSAASNRYP